MTVGLLVVGIWADVVNGGVLGLEFVVPVSYLLEVLSDMMVGALAVGIGAEVLGDLDVNVSAAVMTALEFSMSIPLEELNC